MEITLIHGEEPGAYTLLVDGEPTVREETFTICDAVRYHLEHPEAWDASETAEIADTIRAGRGL